MNTLALLVILAGNFTSAHPVRFPGYATEAACVGDQGKWVEDTCIFDAEDTVVVKQSGKSYSVAISTVGSNAHECSFDAPATRVSSRELVASAPSHVYGANGRVSPSVCKVSIMYAADGSLSTSLLSSYDSCQDFCGASVGLGITRATRR